MLPLTLADPLAALLAIMAAVTVTATAGDVPHPESVPGRVY